MRAVVRRGHALREVVLVILVYSAYWAVRNLLGDDTDLAMRNAERLLDLQRTLGVDWEQGVQSALGDRLIMKALNIVYTSTHFAVTIGVLLWVFVRRSRFVYSHWRTGLLATTCVALVGYASFPLMPPRLVPGIGIIDGLEKWGALWDYHSGPIGHLSNQYAAMPSVHVAWALWCSMTIWSVAAGRSRPVARVVAVAYTLLVALAVVATGNHWVLDIVGGVAVTLAGVGFATARERSRRRRHATLYGEPTFVEEEPALVTEVALERTAGTAQDQIAQGQIAQGQIAQG